MMLYIKALGFSEFNTKEKAEKLVSEVIQNPNSRYISNYKTDEIKVEYYKEFGDDFGLMVRGALSEDEELTIYSLIPFATGSTLIDTHELDVIKGDDHDIYNVFCEEMRSGTPVSFFLQNVIDYFEIDEEEEVFIDGVRLVAFSVEGTVILPIDKDEEDLILEAEEDDLRQELLEKARNGDEEAMQLLEDEAVESSEILQERLKEEDLLSILEGFFVPLEDSDDIYSILGNIEEVSQAVNRLTEERLYILKVSCMNLAFDVYINMMDLTGVPSPGMRIKCTSWIHGLVEFDDYGLDGEKSEEEDDFNEEFDDELEEELGDSVEDDDDDFPDDEDLPF